MRRHKLPPRLEYAALDALVDCVGQRIVDLLREDSATLERGISLVRDTLCVYLASVHSRFVTKMLRRVSRDISGKQLKRWREKHGTNWLNVIIDDRVESLGDCDGVTDRFMDLVWSHVSLNFHKFSNLKTLCITRGCRLRPYRNWMSQPDFLEGLKGLRMNHLTTFVYRVECVDATLEFLASSCPNLEVLDVFRSQAVTSNGVKALQGCPKLRVVELGNCCRVTGADIEQLLLTHKNIRNLSLRNEQLRLFDGCEGFKDHPGVEYLSVVRDELTEAHLRGIAATFPNLRSLELSGCFDGDPTILGRLEKLCRFRIVHSDFHVWKPLLKEIGKNVTCLEMDIEIDERDLDFIWKSCKKIQDLRISYYRDAGPLVLPPFPKMKRLILCGRDCPDLVIPPMLSLESIDCGYFFIPMDKLESIIFDSKNFPNLSEISISKCDVSLDVEEQKHVLKLIRERNFDFRITFYGMIG